MSCPKCGFKPKEGAESCARCGLVFANWTPEMASEVVKLDEKHEQLWTEVQAHWDDEAKHDAFLKSCSAAGLLAAAGRCYRHHADTHPEDQVAPRMQDRVLALATKVVFALRPQAPTPITRTRMFWAVLVGCGIAGAIGALLLGR